MLLPDFVSGHLSESDRTILAAHIAECQACRLMLSTMQTLSTADVQTGTHLDDHPSREQLAAYYQDSELGSKGDSQRIKLHLSQCDVCRREFEFLLELERNLQPGREQNAVQRLSTLHLFTKLFRTPALGYALALLLLYPAVRWMGHEQLPADSSPGLVLPDTIFSLMEIQRGAGSIPTVYRSAIKSLVLLRLPYYAMPTERQYHFTIESSMSTKDSSVYCYADFTSLGHITLLADLSEYSDGSLILHLYETSPGSASDTMIADYPFELITR